MKILYSVDYYQPQLGYSEYFIPRQLQKLGHEVIIFTSNYYFPFPKYDETAGKLLGERQQKPGKSRKNGITIIKQPMKYEVFTRAIFDGHEEIVKEFQPDLVMVNKIPGYNCIRFAQLKKKYGYKLLAYDAHLPSGFYAEGNILAKYFFYAAFQVLFARLLQQNVDTFIAVQEETEVIIRQFYGIQKKIVHIPLGTDTDLFSYSASDRAAVRKKYKLSSKNIVVIYTGKIIEEKGVSLLFEAANRLFPDHPQLRLLLVGAGSEEYIHLCHSKLQPEFSDRVIWTGFQKNEKLPALYSASDIGVWPLQESTAMNDAAACNLPFIANDEIGARARLANKNAFLYKKGNSKDLAKKIEKLILNPVERKAMGKRGRKLMVDKLSWKSVVDEYLKL